jgi:hypothetical protein
MTILPEVQAMLALRYGLDWNSKNDNEQILEEGIHIYPSDFFDCPRYNTMERVVSIHRAMGGWRTGNENNIPDYTSTNPLKKDFKFFFQKYLNGFFSKFKIGLIKIS